MPVYVVKDLKTTGDRLPTRHLDPECSALQVARENGKEVERRNNTNHLKESTERCPSCMSEDAVEESKRRPQKETADRP